MSYGRNGANDGKDLLGRELQIGQQVAKPHVFGRSPGNVIKTVTRVEDGNVYLDGWHSPVIYSGRLVIISNPLDFAGEFTQEGEGRSIEDAIRDHNAPKARSHGRFG